MAIDPQLISTVRVGELPVGAFELTDKIAHEKGVDLFSGTVADLIDLVRLNSNAFQFEIKYLNVINQYIIDNFEGTGLGKDLCLGWAICNGQNGTKNLDGKVLIGYGSTYNVAGGTGGSKDAVLVAHSHVITEVYNENNTGTKVGSGGGTLEAVGTQSVSTAGVSGTDKNMQPYLVTLVIQKL